MILSLGLFTSIFLSFIFLPKGMASFNGSIISSPLGRITSFVLIIYILLSSNFLMFIGQFEPMFFDGTISINNESLMSNIGLSIITIMILFQFSDQRSNIIRNEYFLIIMCNLIGLELLIESTDWIITVIAWELLNISLYLLVSQRSWDQQSISVAIKYFLLSAFTTSFLLFGITCIYALTGSTNYIAIMMQFDTMEIGKETILYADLLILIAFIFKIGGAPFHGPIVDLYQSQKTWITTWMMLIPKAGLLIFILRISSLFSFQTTSLLTIAILCLIISSIGLGSQILIKRFLAYSSISHIGYLLLSLVALPIGYQNIFYFYLIVYVLTVFVLFSIILWYEQQLNRDINFTSDLNGIFRINPALSLLFMITLLSLTGIPPLIGFYAKVFIFGSLLNQGLYFASLIGILTSVISAANYLSVLRLSMFDMPKYKYSLGMPLYLSQLLTFIIGGIFIFLCILNPNLIANFVY